MSGKINLVSLQMPNSKYKQLDWRANHVNLPQGGELIYPNVNMHRDSMEFCA